MTRGLIVRSGTHIKTTSESEEVNEGLFGDVEGDTKIVTLALSTDRLEGGDCVDNTPRSSSEDSKKSLRRFVGTRVPRDEVVFLCQMLVIFTVVATSVHNLSTTTEQSELWIALLSSSLGYILPNPRLRHHQ